MKLLKTLAIAFILIGCVSVFGQKNNEQLETGTYLADAYFKGLAKSLGIPYGPTKQNVRVEILSIDNKDNVKAEVTFGRPGSLAFGGKIKGKMSGKIDSSGTLRLEGDVVSGSTVYETKLKATVRKRNDTLFLVNGRIIMVSRDWDWTGEFDKAVKVEEEEW